MPHATGLRLLAGACFVVGGLTVIGAPVLWPIGYLFYKKAKRKEDERERELAAVGA